MKKLAIAVATLALAATPVFACPGHDAQDDSQEQAPRTAEKDKDTKAKEAKPAEKAKPAPKADTAKKAEPKKAEPKTDGKPSEKVSSK
jgi:hypothetical protein